MLQGVSKLAEMVKMWQNVENSGVSGVNSARVREAIPISKSLIIDYL